MKRPSHALSLRIVLTAAAVGWLAGGCAPRRCPSCVPATEPIVMPATCGNATEQTFEKIRNAIAHADGPPEVLLISGGGSYGAWGAGFLYGWSDTTAPARRPVFEIVTGSSTGAIIGTWAFIGPSADANLKAAYTETDDGDVYIKTFPWLWLQPWRWHSMKPWVSIKNLRPLRHLLERRTPIEQVEEVARIYRDEGRVYLVGTVDIDLGGFCLWDMGMLAAPMLGADERTRRKVYDRYIDVVMASCSNPIIFNPTFIGGAMHVDGGVRHQIFAFQLTAPAILDGMQKRPPPPSDPLPSDEDCAAPGRDGRPQVYALINGPMVPPRLCVRDDIYDIGQRALTIMEMQAMVGNLYQAKAKLAPHRADDIRWNLCATHIPDETEVWPFADVFPKPQMRKLFAEAEAKAKSAEPWLDHLPQGGVSPVPCRLPPPAHGERAHATRPRVPHRR